MNIEQNGCETPVEKKTYSAPELVEHGDIHTLVQRRLVFGADGGTPVDNAS